jgi:hypothetical protein
MIADTFKIAVHNFNGELSVNLLGSITQKEYEREITDSAGELILFVEIPYLDPKNREASNPLDEIADADNCWDALIHLSSVDGMCSALEHLLSQFANHLVAIKNQPPESTDAEM